VRSFSGLLKCVNPDTFFSWYVIAMNVLLKYWPDVHREKAQITELHVQDSARFQTELEMATSKMRQLTQHNDTLVQETCELKAFNVNAKEQIDSLLQECHTLQERIQQAHMCVPCICTELFFCTAGNNASFIQGGC
jgi:hypothetical protein